MTDHSNPFTEKEKKLLGSRIVVTELIEYGGKVGNITKGEQGTIYDYSSQSGDPFVELDRGLRVVIPWDSLIII